MYSLRDESGDVKFDSAELLVVELGFGAVGSTDCWGLRGWDVGVRLS